MTFEHQVCSMGFTMPLPALAEVVRRTWRERLFSRPWRPWVATKMAPTNFALVMEMNSQAYRDIQSVTGISDLFRGVKP